MKNIATKKSVSRKGQATQGQLFTMSDERQSGRTQVTRKGMTFHRKCAAIRNSVAYEKTVVLNTTAPVTEGERELLAEMLKHIRQFKTATTQRDLADTLGKSQSRISQMQPELENKGRCVNVSSNGAASYVPAECFTLRWQLETLILEFGAQEVQTELSAIKKANH